MKSWVLIASISASSAATGVNRVADEVVLLQVKDTPPAEDNEKFQYSVMCDEMHGCHYSYPRASTLAPYQLLCDDETGCRYTGVTPPPPTPPAPQLPMPDPSHIQKLLSPFKPPDMSKVQQLLAQLKPSSAPPQSQQLFGQPHSSGVLEMVERLGQQVNHQNPEVPIAPQHAESPQSVGFFVPDNKMCCVDGPLEYVKEKLAKIKLSPIGDGYINAEALEGSCPSQGWDQGPKPEECFPLAKLWYSKVHPIDPLSETLLMAAYAKKHGVALVMQGMAELCRP
mmetsp:Transcript_2564/g.6001  ORF Transcript_2564/g.6001 Transcript_2564/m.6001 type:complete len:282 (+) Transcript_2564:67-912(+)